MNMWHSFATTIWAVSSAGRALPWHGRGQRFDPVTVHHTHILHTAGFVLLNIYFLRESIPLAT